MNTRSPRNPGRHWALTLLGLLGLAVVACQPPAKEAPRGSTSDAADTAVRVEVVTLNTTLFEEILELSGVTEPLRTATITSEIPGRIIRLDVVEGEAVAEGADVLTIDTSTARARIQSIEVQAEQLQRDLERTQRLVDRGLATPAALEQLQSQKDSLRKSINEVRVGTQQARTRAPIGGIVTAKLAEPGEFASPGVPVARIVDIDTIVVNLGLPERDVPFVAEKQHVAIRIEATGEFVPGTVARIGVEANPKNRRFPLEVRVPNPDHTIRAGMRATATIVKRRLPEVVVIPRDAILQAVGGEEVFVVRQDKVVTRPIRLGPGTAGFVVVEEGLAAGDQLVVRGQNGVVSGQTVLIAASEPCCGDQLGEYRKSALAALQAPLPETSPAAIPDATTDPEQAPRSKDGSGGRAARPKAAGKQERKSKAR